MRVRNRNRECLHVSKCVREIEVEDRARKRERDENCMKVRTERKKKYMFYVKF